MPRSIRDLSLYWYSNFKCFTMFRLYTLFCSTIVRVKVADANIQILFKINTFMENNVGSEHGLVARFD